MSCGSLRPSVVKMKWVALNRVWTTLVYSGGSKHTGVLFSQEEAGVGLVKKAGLWQVCK